MNQNEIGRQEAADDEAAFAIELASSAALQALCAVADKKIIRMSWMLGHCKGRQDGLQQAIDLKAAA